MQGKLVPLTHPELLAGALTEFFSPAQQPGLTLLVDASPFGTG